jgi:hypothetical protein
MDAQLDETIETCEAAVEALRRGEVGAEEVCIQTRAMVLICRIISHTFETLLTDQLIHRIQTLLARACAAARDEAVRTEAAIDVDSAAYIAAQLDEFRKSFSLTGKNALSS